MPRWIVLATVLTPGLFLPTWSHGDDEKNAERVAGKVVRVYASPQASWYSIYASPSKFQKLTPLIILVDTGSKSVPIHLLQASGLIPADHVVTNTGPGKVRPADPTQLQLAPKSIPSSGDHCQFTISRAASGIIYAQSMRVQKAEPTRTTRDPSSGIRKQLNE